ncbi:M23 family metallopeptidase [Williamwhitmania taraxaci]|uniref:Peptidase family M23 n=1 Tax=Williamwhitmania taraxaci TaxID=1640674 RepID=A0A1G6GS57_9BACT|nr:M23 family metallopeptidase [Williamwhitmania taraxaci]SDB84713.1 Peptidase family M23 [Williamwhitmania taraxaci]
MQKSKYHFNPESLSFDAVRLSLRTKLVRGLTYFFASGVIAVVYYIGYSFFFDTPVERGLKRENALLSLQFEMLSGKFDQIEKVIVDLEQRDENIYRTIFEADPIPSSIRNAGMGGVSRYDELESLTNPKIVKASFKKLENLSKRVYIQSVSYDELVKLAKTKEEMLMSVPAIQPVRNKDLKHVASPFGIRIHPFYKVLKMHTGMDFTAPSGTEVFATGNGQIIKVEQGQRGYGNVVMVDHGFGFKTLYAHLSSISVRTGQRVKRGDVVGRVGNSGMSMAPHLHYEVLKNDTPINPINFYFNDLTPEEYDRLIELAANSGQSLD